MPVGPGKYDDLCSYARGAAEAEGCILIVLGGKHGSGFSAQLTWPQQQKIPDMLEMLAKQIREDIANGTPP